MIFLETYTFWSDEGFPSPLLVSLNFTCFDQYRYRL